MRVSVYEDNEDSMNLLRASIKANEMIDSLECDPITNLRRTQRTLIASAESAQYQKVSEQRYNVLDYAP